MDTALTSYFQGISPAPRVNTRSLTLPNGVWQPYGIEQWSGYDGIYPARIMEFRNRLGGDIWNAMEPATAVNYYMRHPELNMLVPEERRDQFESVAIIDTVEVYRNKRAFPRAYLVGKTEVIEDKDAMFERMADDEFDPGSIALLERPLTAPLPDGSGDPGTAEYLAGRTNNTAQVEVHANRPAMLILADAYFPGWQAYIDNVPAEIVPVYTVFRGVRVEAGDHRVEFRYEPSSFRIGVSVSAIALLLGGASTFICFYRYNRAANAGR